jgi:hypothetical protein
MGTGAGWYYDSLDGLVVHQNLAESLASAPFSYYHGPYATKQLALQHKGVSGPPATTNEPVSTQLSTAAGQVSGFGPLIQALTSRGTWIRVAEVIVGGGLILVGLNHLAGNPAGAAAKDAAKAAVL